jgi:hypothetical protein
MAHVRGENILLHFWQIASKPSACPFPFNQHKSTLLTLENFPPNNCADKVANFSVQTSHTWQFRHSNFKSETLSKLRHEKWLWQIFKCNSIYFSIHCTWQGMYFYLTFRSSILRKALSSKMKIRITQTTWEFEHRQHFDGQKFMQNLFSEPTSNCLWNFYRNFENRLFHFVAIFFSP